MQNVFDDVAHLDKRCYDSFLLSEDILIEHAAGGMANYILKHFKKNSKVLVVCGGSNNGADGIALVRMLHKDYDIKLFLAKEPTSPMAKLQYKRALSVGIDIASDVCECDVVVDAIVGSGLKGELNDDLKSLMARLNTIKAHKIACDIPSGYLFKADVTLCMGALKKSLFLDKHKDFVGEIKVIDLGVARELYEIDSKCKLLEFSDMKLPCRVKKDSHKGSYGHLGVVGGDMVGASIMSALAANRFGCALVTLVTKQTVSNLPYSIMNKSSLPKNISAIVMGMGLGSVSVDAFLQNSLPIVVDADLFYKDEILEILKRADVVLTPHPKEFISLLKITKLADTTLSKLQNDRFSYCELFAKTYPNVTLLLKGANMIIARGDEIFINPHASENLAKGGSGDVLSGLIGSLLAQGYNALEATKSASLALSKLSRNFNGASFSLTPQDLIDNIKDLKDE